MKVNIGTHYGTGFGSVNVEDVELDQNLPLMFLILQAGNTVEIKIENESDSIIAEMVRIRTNFQEQVDADSKMSGAVKIENRDRFWFIRIE
jgi:hypothetical protein